MIGLLALVLMLAGLTLPTAAPADAAPGRAASGPRLAPLKAPSPAVAAKPSQSLASTTAAARKDPKREDAGSGKPYRVRELKSKRGERSTTHVMSDGTRQVTLSTSPVHWRESSSDEWEPIETEVAPGSGATAFVNEKNVFETRFGESRGDLATATGDGWSVSLGAVGADGKPAAGKVAPKAKGSQVTVDEVFGTGRSAAGLRYSVGAGELKEEILLPNATAAEAVPAEGFTFTLELKGLVAKKFEGGAIGLYKSKDAKRPRLVLPAPFMTDAAGVRSDEVTQSLGEAADGTTTVTIKPDAGWLGESSRDWPVSIDPTLVYAPDAADGQDVSIGAGSPDTARPSEPTIAVGVGATGAWRGLFKFDTSAIPAGSQVYAAQLRLHFSSVHNSETEPVEMRAYPVTKTWSETTATWNGMNTSFTNGNFINQFLIDDSDSGATSFAGPWKDVNDTAAVYGSYASLTSGTTADTFDWNAKLPWSGLYDTETRHLPGASRGTPTYVATGDQGSSTSIGIDQTAGTAGTAQWRRISSQQHFAPGATARIRMTRQSGTTATAPMADAVRWIEYNRAFKPATQRDGTHTYGLGTMVKSWIDNPAANHGVMVKALDESATAPVGGPYYHSSDAPYAAAAEGDTRPQLVVVLGQPGPVQDVPTTVHADGPELSWSSASDPSFAQEDDVAEYQIFRGCVSLPQAACTTPVGEDFTTEYARNGALKLVGTVPADTLQFRDDSAVASTATEKATYRYWVVARTVADTQAPSSGGSAEEGRDGTAVGSPMTVQIPQEGRIARIFTASRVGGPGGDVADTTLSAAKPTTNIPNPDSVTAGDRTWVQAGNNSATYGDERAVFGFDTSPINRRVKVTSTSFELWKSSGAGTASTYDLHEMTSGFVENQATWQRASTAQDWTDGGAYKATAVASASLNNDPDRVLFDTTALKSAVQGWVDGTAGAPNGFLLKIRDEAASTHRVSILNSEAADPGLRPRLRVEHLVKNDDQVFEAPTMPQRFVPGTITRVPVTVTNTTDTAWPSTLELTYRWTEPDSTQDITVEGDRLKVALGRALEPGESVDLTLPVRTPINSDTGSKRLAYDFYLDLRNTTDGTWWSAAHPYKPGGGQNSTPGCAMVATGLLCQDRYVEDPTSSGLGLEKFGTYTGEETGAGSQVLTNLSNGNVTWSYEPVSNPSVGPSAFVRVGYNSRDGVDVGAGFGVSVQAGTLVRLGDKLSVPSGGSTNNKMTIVDGDGTSHTYKLNDDSTTPNLLEYDRPAGVALELHRDTTAPVREQWVFTRPDGTRFLFAQESVPAVTEPVPLTAVDAGFQTAVVDTHGNKLSFIYTADGDRLDMVKDSTGRSVLDLNWDTAGLTSITDIAGERIGFSYNAAHQLTGLSDTAAPGSGVPAGQEPVKRFGLTYTSDSTNGNAMLSTVTDPRGGVSKMEYFTSTENSAYANWPKTFTDRRNKTTTFAYSDPDSSEGKDTVAVITDTNTTTSPGGGTPGSPGNTVTTYRSDGYGRTTQITDSLQQVTKLGWDRDHNVIRLEEANGAVSTWDYDNRTGYPLTIRDAQTVKNGGAGVKLTYERLPNAPGAPTALKTKTSAAGRAWTFTNDPATGALKSVADPLGNTTSYTYTATGLLATATDAKGAVTTYNTYDESGMPTKVTSQIDASTSRFSEMTYDKRGNTLTVTDPLRNVSTVEYDGFSRPTKVTTPGDDSAPGSPKATRTTVSAYDLNDNLTSSTAPNGAVTTSTYNATDLPTRQELPDNNTTGRAITTSYDDLGQLVEQTAPEGVATTSNANDFVTRYVYDKVGQQIRVDVPFVDTDGTSKTATTKSSYDTVGNLVETVDPVKNATAVDSDYTARIGYDLNHRPITSTDAKGYVTKTEYDADGLVTATIDPRGVRVRKVYDPVGRPIETHVPHTAWGATSARDQVTKTTYDKVGQVTKTTSPTGRASETIYNLAGEVIQTKAPFKTGDADYPSPASTFYTYDGAGRLEKQSLPTFDAAAPGETSNQWTKFDYFPSGEIKTSTDPWGLVTSYLYNQLGQQTQRKFSSPAADDATRTTSMSYYPDGSLAGKDDQAPRELIKYYTNALAAHFTASPTANWATVTGTDPNIDGSNYRTHPAAAAGSAGASDTATWKVTPDNDDTYEVKASCPVRTDTTTAAVYTINTADGAKTTTMNQKACTTANKWVSLGSYRFDAATTKTIVLKPSADGVVVADGIQLVPSKAGPSKAYAYTYDRNGLTTQVKDNTAGAKSDTYKTSYDGLGRAATATELVGATTRRTTSYTYDLNSNLTSTFADRKADADTGGGNMAATRYTGYTYDVRNMVATVATGPQSTSADSRYSYEYDSRGLPVSLTKPNGNRVGYSFYEDRLLRTSDERTSAERGKQVVAAHTLDYDADGQKSFDVAKLDQAGSTGTLDQRSTFSYTPAGQLAGVDKTGADAGDDESYTYDAAGNTISQVIGAVTSTSNFDRNRLTNSAVTGNGTTYSRYDSYGRLISRDNAGQVVERYAYDGFDRTTREQRFDSAGVLQLTKTQSFDPFDRTTTQSTAITGKPTKSLRFTYLGTSDQVAVEEEKNTSGAWEVAKNYAYGPSGEKLQLTDTPVNGSTNETQYYGTNPHGDVETLSKADGTTASTYRYTAYGAPDKKGTTGQDAYSTAASDTDKMAADLDSVNPYRFSGKRIHGGTGTYDIGFRDYDPGINRFLTRDFYQGALKDLALGTDPWNSNRYAYAGGNPIGMVDLDGHYAIDENGDPDPVQTRVTMDAMTRYASDEGGTSGGEAGPDSGSSGDCSYGRGYTCGSSTTGDDSTGASACPDSRSCRLVQPAVPATATEALHQWLTLLGLVPGLGEPADLTDASVYLAEGDEVGAGISAAAAVPILGWLAAAKKIKSLSGTVDQQGSSRPPVERRLTVRGSIARSVRRSRSVMLLGRSIGTVATSTIRRMPRMSWMSSITVLLRCWV
ncbi:MAG: DNRLRE domain-containing protein [Actinomycetota bacterium]|nr:DNRLRE domain-containing protein [Actinomycetota bacterium]